MKIVGKSRKRGFERAAYLFASLACLMATASLAGTVAVTFEGWELERGLETPSYAVIDPVSTNLNVDSVVLACEEANDRRGLQLQLYLSTEEPLLPNGADPRWLKNDPRAQIAIDGRVFPVELFFGEDHAVLADDAEKAFPLLSARLLDAMQAGKIMILRFDLVAEQAGQPADFDGEVIVDLQAGAGGTAVAALQLCADQRRDGPSYTADAGSRR